MTKFATCSAHTVLNFKSISPEHLATLRSTLSRSLQDPELDIGARRVIDDTIELRIRSSVFEGIRIEKSNDQASAFRFHDTAALSIDHKTGELVLEKLADMGYFTLERAFSDAVKVINILVDQ